MFSQCTASDLGTKGPDLDRALDRAKARAFRHKNAAFLGPLLTGLTFVWTRDMPTAATNGTTLWWNPDWFISLTKETRETVLMHELWHIALLHLVRINNRHPERWNIAADIVINNDLENDGYSFVGVEDCWKDQSFCGQSVEQVYDAMPTMPNGGSWGSLDGGDLFNPTPAEQQKMVNNVVQAVQTAKITGNEHAIPGEVVNTLDQFLKPKIDWRIALQRFFQDFFKEDYSWSRPSRRYTEQHMPSMAGEGQLIDLNYYLDVSGSVSDAEVTRFNSEIKFIKETFRPKKLRLVLFDTAIRAVYELDENEPFNKLVVVGRGGTNLEPVRQHIEQTKPSAAVIFSDMWVTPMRPVKTPVIWVAINHKGCEVTCGTIIHISE
jgi:predicted metal-dependent peptidase